jgi:hypothetical protein
MPSKVDAISQYKTAEALFEQGKYEEALEGLANTKTYSWREGYGRVSIQAVPREYLAAMKNRNLKRL